MAIQNSVAARNARLDSFETVVGTSPILRVFSGAMPASCAAASSGTLLAEMTLPSDWLAAASGGSKAKSGTWEDLSANAAGTMGYYRIFDSAGTVCHEQGTITLTAGGGDMTVDNTNVQAGQSFTITGYTKTAGNA
jgi:hypothetical protein